MLRWSVILGKRKKNLSKGNLSWISKIRKDKKRYVCCLSFCWISKSYIASKRYAAWISKSSDLLVSWVKATLIYEWVETNVSLTFCTVTFVF